MSLKLEPTKKLSVEETKESWEILKKMKTLMLLNRGRKLRHLVTKMKIIREEEKKMKMNMMKRSWREMKRTLREIGRLESRNLGRV
jgi:hypothetical protein